MMLPNDVGFGAWIIVVTGSMMLGIVLLQLFSSKQKNLPPGPRGLPIIGALHLMGKHPHKDLAKLAETYGPVMSLWFGQKLVVVASSPAAAKEFLKTQGLNFSSRPISSFGELVGSCDVGLAPDTPERRHLKKILHMQLSTTKQLQQTSYLRTEEIDHMLQIIPNDGTNVLRVRTYIEVMVTNVLSRMVLKKRFMASTGRGDERQELEEVRKFRELMEETTECSLHADLGEFIPILKRIDIQGFRRRLRNLKKRMDAFMSNIVSEHLEQRKCLSLSEKDMVDVLLDQMEDETLTVDITNQHVNDVLWDVFVAGSSTIIDAVEWALAECIRNPNVMTKVQAELDAVVGKSRRVEDADIPKLKYLQAIIKENFRLHPIPLLFPHENQNACKVFGYDIPAQTTVFVNASYIARDPSIWEDPLAFKPERFLDGMAHANTDVQGNHFELVIFGSGRRSCPGMTLAIAMVHILTATLLQSFTWSLPIGLQPMDLDMLESEGLMPSRAQRLSAIPKARMSISPSVA